MAGHGTWRTTRHRQYERKDRDNPAYLAAYQAAEEALLLGQRVHDRRVQLGLTQAELANRAGMTEPQVSRLETGGATPSVPLLHRLARALDTDGEGLSLTGHSGTG